jgi:hypothetical protein
MSPRDPTSPDLVAALRRLKHLLDTLLERFTLARQQKLAYHDLLLLVLSDEVTRRDGAAAEARAPQAQLAIVGPVGVEKTFLGHALGHVAASRRYSVVAETADHLLETLRHARLDHTLRRSCANAWPSISCSSTTSASRP